MLCNSIDNLYFTQTEEIVGNPLCSSRLAPAEWSHYTTSPKLITSLLINTKISIDLIREIWNNVSNFSVPVMSSLGRRRSMSGPDHEPLATSSVLPIIRNIGPVIIWTLLEKDGTRKGFYGVAQGALTCSSRQHVSSAHIRHFTMIQHVQLLLPCLQSRTKTTCNYQKYTFSSITWYVNKPTNVGCNA